MDQIGRFEIVGKLGRGASGLVYKGRELSTKRLAAIKVLSEADANDKELVARLREEAQVLGRMVHPAIPRVYEVGDHHGLPYVAMEYLEGDDLASVMGKRIELPVERKVDIVRQVAEGLEHAHTHVIVHGDVKPANIRLLQDGTVKIMDFGSARTSSPARTKSGHILGTKDYMSPEQVLGASVDGRSDLFSLGCLFYELLAGRRPFHSDNLMAIFYKITQEEPRPLEELMGTPHEWLNEVVLRCLRKDPAERFESCGALAEVLRAGMAQPLTSTIGRFEVLGSLADGATGCVLKVRDPEDGSLYAVRKVDVFSDDALQKLRRTAKDASRVGHPAIVRVSEFGWEHNLPYVVMDYVEGESLRARLASAASGRALQPLTLDASIDVVRQLLMALEAAHSQGIVHGEVDPSNIMLTPDGALRLLGFGLVELREPGRSFELPRVCYYSPEKIDGERPDRRSDVFSVGVILYEILGGRRPFDGDNPYDVMQRIVFESAPTLEARPGPEGLVHKVVEKALAKAPERRYATAYQMVLDLDRCRLAKTSGPAIPALPPQRVGPATMAEDAGGAAFDVFLCHGFGDKPAVRELSTELTRRGLRPWLDEEQLRPGLPWQERLEAQIEGIAAVAVIVGASGLGPWQDMELRAFLNEFAKRRCPVIPVLLSSCPTEPKLPLFLSGMTWVDFRKPKPDPMDQLIWGITGRRPPT